ncbi:hypothetical protein KQX54_017624 [Cotesia glomerata]|uniref:Uncharacterized protein n=1 Tax=Cotesia glomerata TaxID=32391 RepID=A0AAV7IG74_COTGL|nr:hypothetical protein KQX54_017624 [Cotesia glomerata]
MQAPRYAWTSWKDSTRSRDPRGFHITLYASYVMCRKLQYTREKSFVKRAMMHYEERPDILYSLAQLLGRPLQLQRISPLLSSIAVHSPGSLLDAFSPPLPQSLATSSSLSMSIFTSSISISYSSIILKF